MSTDGRREAYEEAVVFTTRAREHGHGEPDGGGWGTATAPSGGGPHHALMNKVVESAMPKDFESGLVPPGRKPGRFTRT